MEKVSDFYEDISKFEELLEQAEEKATSHQESQFVDDLMLKFADYGEDTFLSESQKNWLEQIANK